MQFTKGPWRISDTPKDEIFNRYLLTGPGNEIIATIHAPMAPVELPESEVEANARLISSAPDLLEALISATELLDSIPMMKHHTKSLHAAIKRATGD